MISTDIVIVGGGCVGLTLALALAEKNIPVAVIDSQPQQQPLLAEPELRVSALSASSQAVFTRLGVWQDMLDTRATPYKSMHVWEKDSFGSITFAAEQIHYSELGHIVENKVIRNALVNKLAKYDDVATLLFDQTVEQMNVGEREVLVTLSNGQPVIGQLLVAADGANSFVRQQMQLPLTFWDYEHTAIVATIKTELPHQHQAAQCFLPDGPLAFLPLSFAPNASADGEADNEHYCSIVWSTSPEHAKLLIDSDDESFNRQLTTAFDGRLGLCEVVSDRMSFPLKMRYARQWVKPRVALIGDAAHTIHPLAGLGMNLGLLDAATLAQTIIAHKNNDKDPGVVAHLRHFERWRKSEAQTLIAAMEGLKRVFSGTNPVLKLIRSTGLSLADNVLPAKHEIIKRAMGLEGDLPDLAKPLPRQ
ncbi:MAG: 2-octaprenylphenol hydroxylase [Phenylobacterium sp.]|jgi:2-octaprenylphenol hydroxylase